MVLNLLVAEHKAFSSCFEGVYEGLPVAENKVTFLSYVLLHYKFPIEKQGKY